MKIIDKMETRVESLDESRWADVAKKASRIKTPETEEYQRRVEALKAEKNTFRLLMEQIGEYHLLPEHLRKEADELLGIKGWALIPIFKKLR